MAITIDDLRQDWLKQIEAYDGVIALLEREQAHGIQNEGLHKPTREWTGKLHQWRDDLKALLAIYPPE